MKSANDIEWLQGTINKSIRKYERRRNISKAKSIVLRISLFSLSGAATIVLGVNLDINPAKMKNIAFVLSTVVTILSALESLYNPRSLWIEYESALARLASIKRNIDYKLSVSSKEITSHWVSIKFKEYSDLVDEIEQNAILVLNNDSQGTKIDEIN